MYFSTLYAGEKCKHRKLMNVNEAIYVIVNKSQSM